MDMRFGLNQGKLTTSATRGAETPIPITLPYGNAIAPQDGTAKIADTCGNFWKCDVMRKLKPLIMSLPIMGSRSKIFIQAQESKFATHPTRAILEEWKIPGPRKTGGHYHQSGVV